MRFIDLGRSTMTKYFNILWTQYISTEYGMFGKGP